MSPNFSNTSTSFIPRSPSWKNSSTIVKLGLAKAYPNSTKCFLSPPNLKKSPSTNYKLAANLFNLVLAINCTARARITHWILSTRRKRQSGSSSFSIAPALSKTTERAKTTRSNWRGMRGQRQVWQIAKTKTTILTSDTTPA